MRQHHRRVEELEARLKAVPEVPLPVSEEHARVRELIAETYTRFRKVRDEDPEADIVVTEPWARELVRDIRDLSNIDKHYSRGFPLDPHAAKRLRARGFEVGELV
jgi:hypothetical protein